MSTVTEDKSWTPFTHTQPSGLPLGFRTGRPTAIFHAISFLSPLGIKGELEGRLNRTTPPNNTTRSNSNVTLVSHRPSWSSQGRDATVARTCQKLFRALSTYTVIYQYTPTQSDTLRSVSLKKPILDDIVGHDHAWIIDWKEFLGLMRTAQFQSPSALLWLTQIRVQLEVNLLIFFCFIYIPSLIEKFCHTCVTNRHTLVDAPTHRRAKSVPGSAQHSCCLNLISSVHFRINFSRCKINYSRSGGVN